MSMSTNNSHEPAPLQASVGLRAGTSYGSYVDSRFVAEIAARDLTRLRSEHWTTDAGSVDLRGVRPIVAGRYSSYDEALVVVEGALVYLELYDESLTVRPQRRRSGASMARFVGSGGHSPPSNSRNGTKPNSASGGCRIAGRAACRAPFRRRDGTSFVRTTPAARVASSRRCSRRSARVKPVNSSSGSASRAAARPTRFGPSHGSGGVVRLSLRDRSRDVLWKQSRLHDRRRRPSRGRSADEDGDRWRCLVLEDTGELMTPDARRSHRARACRGFSNVVDGLIGQGFNVFALVTTNEPLRGCIPRLRGRDAVSRSVEFPPLPLSEANRWLESQGSAERVRAATTLASCMRYVTGSSNRRSRRSGSRPLDCARRW